MLKRISADQVRAGMFVEAVEGAWLNAPSVARRFIVDSETAAEVIRTSNVSAVFINTALGLDMPRSAFKPNVAACYPAVEDFANKQINSPYLNEVSSAVRTLNETTTLLRNVFEAVRFEGDVKYEDLAPIVKMIAKSIERNPSILIGISRLKDKDDTTYLHSVSVAAFMIRFARYLKLGEDIVHILGVSGLVHDIGKLKISTEVLNKPGHLTDAEIKMIRDHPSIGHKMLSRQSDMPDVVLDVCLHHHERIDGSGYPMGLKGDEISFGARVAAICDVYDAVTSVRPYRAPWTVSQAATWMLETRGVFDRMLLLQFLGGVMRT